MSRATRFLPVIEANALADAAELLGEWCVDPSHRQSTERLVAEHRRAGIASLLRTGLTDTFQRRVQRAARVALASLEVTPMSAQRRSRVRTVFDALAVGDLDTARALSRAVRDTRVPDEAPEDFAFVHVVMRLVEGDADALVEPLLDAWAVALEGTEDLRLVLLRALLARDVDALTAALDEWLTVERADGPDRGPEAAATEAVVSLEALGLVALAAHRGLVVTEPLRDVPTLARGLVWRGAAARTELIVD